MNLAEASFGLCIPFVLSSVVLSVVATVLWYRQQTLVGALKMYVCVCVCASGRIEDLRIEFSR